MVSRHSRLFMLMLVLIMIFAMQSTMVTAETNTLTYEGKDFTVELQFTNRANISENATLKVTEFYEGSKEYQEYYSQTDEFIKDNTKNQIAYVRFFDISILDGEEETEPDDVVDVSITYSEGIEKHEMEELSIIHFVEEGNPELIEVKEEVVEQDMLSQISFEQESFSVIGMIVFDGVDTEVKEVESETITKTVSFDVWKEWSDGYEVHKDDSVTVTLYEILSGGWKECDEVILNQDSDWKGKFENLDRSKEYGIRETKVTSKNEDIKTTYQSEITSTTVKSWCPKTDNRLSDGERFLLTFGDSKKNLLRKSSSTSDFNLRSREINIVNETAYGEHCINSIAAYEIWESYWNEEHKAWEFYHSHSDVYLSLIYDEATGQYVWATSKEKTEGSYLNFQDGKISATVNGVTKYLGNITSSGPYTGLDKEDAGIESFRVFTYQVFQPGTYIIRNTKNETIEEQKIQTDVITDKKIDYLGDAQDNPDTEVDDKENRNIPDKILKDLYRLKLSLNMQTDVTGLDLLMVIDVSSSMNGNKDCKDAEGKYILRSEALRQALNEFIPELLPENTKNRVSIVAFENQSMILRDWTQDAQEVLEKVNDEVDGTLPLYNGEGTNYESALTRAHEALTKRGYSGNAKAMIFLSDGEPTVYIYGNDDLEAGNVTVNLGDASIANTGIEGTLPELIRAVWCSSTDERLISSTNEAIDSFRRHNPEIMIGTIAFNTKVTDYLKNLATDSEFVTQIQNGTPDDLVEAMELITEFVPENIAVMDELSDYVELYEEKPDFKVTVNDENAIETVLFSPVDGITKEGETVLDENEPLSVEGKMIRMNFRKEFVVKNGHTYHISFNIRPSQKAYDQYADQEGGYHDKGDDDTDYPGNTTSSSKEGFYSNGDNTKVNYLMNGVVFEKRYRKPVVQVEDGSLSIVKKDLDGKVISNGAEFVLYRKADENDTNKVSLDGVKGEFVEVAAGMTDENGELVFEHLRLAVFDEGYPYYLVETKAAEGYVGFEEPIPITLFKDDVETEENHSWVYVDDEGKLIVRNAEYVEPLDLPVTGGSGKFMIYMTGMILTIGGIFMLRKKRFSKLLMMVMAMILGCHMASSTVCAIEKGEQGAITVKGVEEMVSVSAYRLMDINFDYDVNQPKNPMYKWVDGVAGWMSENYPEYIDEENQNAVNESFSEAEEVKVAELYDKLAVAVKDGTVSISANEVEAEEDTVVIDNLTMGNYFILIEGGLKVYRPLSANVVPEWKDNVWQMSSPTVTAKSSAPSITKEITGGLREDNANIGDTVSFELSAVIPSYPENAKAKKFVVSDKLSEGLTLLEDSLKVYGVNSGKEDELLTKGYERGTERTVDEGDKQVSFALDFDYAVISGYESLKITYDAVLNEKAVVGEIGNGNVALLDFSNNPYSAENYSTDGDETTVYTYGMKISKVDEDTNKGLSGAQFTLSKDGQDIYFTGANGMYHVAGSKESGSTTVVVDDNGFLTLKGLDVGTYSLTEVKAPEGYVKLQNPIEIVITDNNVNGKVEGGGQELSDGYVSVTVKNDTGFTLPVTGGMGTTLFNVVGIVLMGSGLLLIVAYIRKRRSSR